MVCSDTRANNVQMKRNTQQRWLSALSLCHQHGDAENARPENDGQRKLWVWKMQDWRMTDKLLANCEHNYVCIFDVYLAHYRKTLLELD